MRKNNLQSAFFSLPVGGAWRGLPNYKIYENLFSFISFSLFSFAQQKPWIDFNRNGKMDVYENPNAQTDERVNNLLSQMTVEEKMQILHEVSPAIPRLGVAKYDHGNEALHGIIRPGKFTVFPQTIALGATWNPELIQQVSLFGSFNCLCIDKSITSFKS